MNSKKTGLQTILNRVLQEIVPTAEENAAHKKIARELEAAIKTTKGKHMGVHVLGSFARNTHLKGDYDIDLFVFFPKQLKRAQFEKAGLDIGKKVLQGHFWEEAYSEHPYIRGTYKGYDVEIVPTYKVKGAHEKQSSVDRTPFHHQYLTKRMKEKQKNEVRLLKRFLKGIHAYGADTRYNSLSGYGVELLILKYKTFQGALKAIAKWTAPVVIDLEHYWQLQSVKEKFAQHSLIIIDPVDSERNVAAALSEKQMQHIILQSKHFLRHPGRSFFFPSSIQPLSPHDLKEAARKQQWTGTHFSYPAHSLADIVWGQLKRFEKKIVNHLEQFDFQVVRSTSYSDEKKHCIILIQLRNAVLPAQFTRQGPFQSDVENVKRFLQKHHTKKFFIQNGRVTIHAKRQVTQATILLKKFLREVKRTEKKPLQKGLEQNQVINAKNISMLSKRHPTIATWATQFYKKK